MAKLEELLKQSFPEPELDHAQNRREIILRKDEILTAIAKGWPVRHIWKALKDAGELTCGYSTFAKRINKIIAKEKGK